MYSVSSYYLSKMAWEFPIYSLSPLLFLIPCFFICNLRADSLGKFYIVFFLQSHADLGISYLVACYTDNLDKAVYIMPIMVLYMCMFSGFVVNLSSIGPWIAWLQYTTPLRFSYEALVNV
mmetsp:Transcript_9439/g.6807  ORF Transcript_9439/g.6807 Transcript_9439/m.6807 type:complete len:120 (+) Transcript_9439:1543-1902(+)